MKWVVTGNWLDDDEYRFRLDELAEVEKNDNDLESVFILTLDDGMKIYCDNFVIVKE